MAQKHFKKTGVAAEIGVFQGGFAQNNLKKWTGDYWAIDAWAHRKQRVADRNFASQDENDANFNATAHATARFGDRVHLLRSLSVDAAQKFADGTFDWIYVDALHTVDAAWEDMHAWWPKLREGGLFSGDDYGDYRDVEYLDRAKMNQLYGRSLQRLSRWGVIRAVTKFAQIVGAPLHATFYKGKSLETNASKLQALDEKGENHCYFFPAWYMVKPPASYAGTPSKSYGQAVGLPPGTSSDDNENAAEPPESPYPPPPPARRAREHGAGTRGRFK